MHPINIQKLEKLKTTIQNTPHVASKPWLLEKVDELLDQASKIRR
jgi:hypothetical protein